MYFFTYIKTVVICWLKTFSMFLTLGKMSGGGDDNAARYGEVFSVLKKGNEINLRLIRGANALKQSLDFSYYRMSNVISLSAFITHKLILE